MTFRAVLISMILLVGLCVAIAFGDHWKGSLILLTGANHLPTCVVFVLILLAAVINPLLGAIRKRSMLTQAEMISIWCIVAAGVGVPAFGLVHYMLPFMVAPFYYVGAESRWATLIYEHVPHWLVPSKDPNSPIVTMFFESKRSAPFPWEALAAWVVPFIGWSVVIVAFLVMVFCIVAILRKQWVEHERLSFPLAQIPLEIARPPEAGRWFNQFFRSPATWAGAALPIAFWGLTLLNGYFPNVPFIGSRNWALESLFRQILPGWTGFFWANFLAVGVAFLISTEVSLSIWFFFLLSSVQRALRIRLGVQVSNDFEIRQEVGGFIAFLAVMLWTMRHHLRDVLRKAFAGARDVDDSGNGFSYRFAVFGFILSSLVIIGWLWTIGCPPHVSALFLVFACMVMIVLSRLVAQCGLVLVQTSLPSGPLSIVQDFLGDGAIGPRGLTALTFHQAPMYGDPREILMPTLLNNTKLAERGRFMKRLFIAMLAATIIAFAISYFLQVATFYMYGATVDLYTVRFYPVYAMDRLASAIQTPKAAFQFDSLGPAKGIFHVLVGGGAFLIVSFLRSRLHWWPIHPVGILTAHSMPAHRLWFLFFVGWACKGLAQKYAKGPSFAIIKRFFLGLIIGEILIQMVSTLLPIIFLK